MSFTINILRFVSVVLAFLSVSIDAYSQPETRNYFCESYQPSSFVDSGEEIYFHTTGKYDKLFRYEKASREFEIIDEIFCFEELDGFYLDYLTINDIKKGADGKLWILIGYNPEGIDENDFQLNDGVGLVEFDGENAILHNYQTAGFPDEAVGEVPVPQIGCYFVKRNGEVVVAFLKSKTEDQYFGVYDGESWDYFTLPGLGIPVDFYNQGFKYGEHEDSKGNVFFGYFSEKKGYRIIKYDGSGFEAIIPNFSSFRFGSIFADQDDRIWLTTEKEGEYAIFDGDSWTSYQIDKSAFKGEYLSCYGFDGENNLWLKNYSTNNSSEYSYKAIVKVDDFGYEIFDDYTTNYSFKIFNSFGFNSDGEAYFTVEEGIVRYTDGALAFIDVSKMDTEWSRYRHKWLLYDGHKYYTCSYNLGSSRFFDLIEITNDSFDRIKIANSDINGYILDIEIDRGNRVWLIAVGAVHIFDGDSFRTFKQNDAPFLNDVPGDLAVDSTNRVWISGDRAIYSFYKGDWTVRHFSVLPDVGNGSKEISVDSRGNVWFYNRPDYNTESFVGVFDKSGITTFDSTNSPLTLITNISQSPQGKTWFVCGEPYNYDVNFTHFAVFDGEKWDSLGGEEIGAPHFEEPNDICDIDFISDNSGVLWGGKGSNLLKFDGERLEIVDSTSFAGFDVKELRFDREGTLWAAANRGLIKYRGPGDIEIFNSCTTDIPGNNVSTPRFDYNGNVWFSCNGLNVMNENGIVLSAPKIEAKISEIDLSVYPNPSTSTTRINYLLPNSCEITLKISDIFGRNAATIAEGYREAGIRDESFDTSGLPGGVYFISLIADEILSCEKLIVIE